MSNLKIVVALHEGDKETRKINPDLRKEYTKDETEKQITLLFPHIKKKGFKLELYHYDELAGKVLENFIEEVSMSSLRKDYLVLHAKDSLPDSLPSTYEVTNEMARLVANHARESASHLNVTIILFSAQGRS
jgi:hypothetical protein